MATLVLSAVGASIGGSIGGSVLGLSSAVIGRAVGATVGQVIDQRLLGSRSQAVETGRVDRFRINGASEGASIPRVWGRMRIPGQVIWASRFKEQTTTSGGGGKGGGGSPQVTEYSYSVSLALVLCEGEITRVSRVWADGREIALDEINLRVYRGRIDQLPDPKIEAVEGVGNVPAYLGLAYVMIEDLQLARFGNRVPQLSFEVLRGGDAATPGSDLGTGVRAVALVPGTGEYALATTQVHFNRGQGVNVSANVNSPSGRTDFATSVQALAEEAPNCRAASLVVSWFGDDLDVSQCQIRPKVEQKTYDGVGMPWSVSGVSRNAADLVPYEEGRAIYGGTPSDRAVMEAIWALEAAGQSVMFYPFILMDQLEANSLLNPYTGTPGQPKLPWRGRITSSLAAGVAGSPDKTLAAADEVDAFFGTATVSDFSATADGIDYTGPAEYSYRRFILHYAHLCAAAGGVDAFCIGSEMPGLTRIRSTEAIFPAVQKFRELATDVRSILGPSTKISYAADWSEYFGYRSDDGSGDIYFNLDPLWADPNIDFIGIDNYMPVSDWRDGIDHSDTDWGAVYNPDYLKGNMAGGEGYDWYYQAPEDEDKQLRTPIEDLGHGEDWVFRYKDIRGWWSNPHHNRPGGVRDTAPTEWVPGSKPIWFTEIGCSAVDKGSNQPNRFIDPKSSESGLPHHSTGARDDVVQMQFLRASFDFWNDPENNPGATLYEGHMVDPHRMFIWAWDTRPYPFFPGNIELWSDGENYSRGHWLNGRIGARALGPVVEEICADAGVTDVDTTRLYGALKGYTAPADQDARSTLQPLMLAYGFDAVERDGRLIFETRTGRETGTMSEPEMVAGEGTRPTLAAVRAPDAEISGRLRLTFVEADGDYETRAVEARFPDDFSSNVSQNEMPLVLTQSEGRRIVDRWLAEARIARDRVSLALPPSRYAYGAGDIITLDQAGQDGLWRIDRVDEGEYRKVEAVRVEPETYVPADVPETLVAPRLFVPALPVEPIFLDLPLLTGDEAPHAPHIAVAGSPWPGNVAVYRSATGQGYALDTLVSSAAKVGITESQLPPAAAGIFDRGSPLRVKLPGASLASVSQDGLLAGANLAAIALPGSDDWEVFQFGEAALVAPDLWDLSFRLRGQLGTDHLAASGWDTGAQFVLLNTALRQVDLPTGFRDLTQYWRIGPASRDVSDPSYVEEERAFSGVGLRPYAPVHLSAQSDWAGGYGVTWIRRTRIDGDTWSGLDVPLGETFESYVLRLVVGGDVVRDTTVSTAAFEYTAADYVEDGSPNQFDIEVAQISDRFGPGPFTRITVNG
ncbi:MAG: glycoside hydrolase TIM-barrel-like domain-containing protein [Pseudomonadota bacterium]